VLFVALAVGCATCQCRDPRPPAASGSGSGSDVEAVDPALQQRLAAAVARRGPGYKPHTRHLKPDGSPKFTNRLILETSPYLLQHAHNPVDWFPWGDAAFAKAAREHKPIFLSIGYSTCHWCHVMEEESFEDEEIAALLNRSFVAIKVDREERPDLDAIYMAAVQQMTGDGGWPMTLLLLPDRRPFFGGTYFPPRDGVRGARIGLVTVLERVRQAYQQDPGALATDASELVAELQRSAAPVTAGDLPGAPAIRAAVAQLAATFDRDWGGFGRAPKFPAPASLELLLRHHRRVGYSGSLEMVTRTLERMAAGGIYDQIGGGFHRYSVDAKWRVPHFEKMLYDNAQLAAIYLEAYQVTGREDFAQVAREILDYVLRDMTSPDGGFYSATDADSAGAEGTYFVWTAAELDQLLGAEDGRIVRTYFDVTAGGNFEHGTNILWRPASLAEVAGQLGLPAQTVQQAVARARPRLLEARSRRVPPLIDRKILVGWNGLMISAFARGALVLDEPRYQVAAARAATYLLAHAHARAGLLHSISEGTAAGDAFLDDHAFLVAGLLDVYETGGDPRMLREATALTDELEAGFADGGRGGYFFTTDRHEKLMLRDKPDHDDALPAGNSIAAANLLRLHELTSDDRYRTRAEATFRAFAHVVADAPTSLPKLLVALDFLLDRPKQIVIVSPPGVEPTALLAQLRRVFVPNRVVLRVIDGAPPVSPLCEGKVARGGKPTAYVCIGTACEQPTTDPAVFARQLAKTEPLPPE
jgi:uncharacterized protein YyaL (SSP411 family)